MLTAIIMLLLYSFDLSFIFYLIFQSDIHDFFLGTVSAFFFHLCLCIVLVRLLILFFPLHPGRYPLGSKEFDRWRAYGVVFIASSSLFYPLIPMWLKGIWFRLFGAKIAFGANISGIILDPPLVTIKKEAKVGFDSVLLGHFITKNGLVLGPVTIGEGATVGTRSTVLPHTEIEALGTLAAQSLLSSGKRIGSSQTWGGMAS